MVMVRASRLETQEAATVSRLDDERARRDDERAERVLSHIILPASCTMIGVCATIIGLVKIVQTRGGPSHVDEYSALVLLLFLVSAGASYLSIRHTARRLFSTRCELVADGFFLAGLFAIAVIGLFFAYEII